MLKQFQHVRAEQDGPVGRITIQRPHVRNALNEAAAAELTQALRTLGRRPEVGVIVLRGAGEEAFCAGADLKELADRHGVLERRAYFSGIGRLVRTVAQVPVPVVAMVYGYALAGGCGLVAACDLAYAADDAVFGLPELHVGLFPMMVMAPIIRTVGRKKAMELFFTGRRVDASQAVQMGLITGSVPRDQLEETVEGVLSHIGRFSPAVLRLGKEAASRMDGMAFPQALDYLEEMIAVTASTEDAAEGIGAFLEKRPPRWRGR